MCKNITPRNEQGHRHGYWEYYHSNGQLFFKGNFVNNKKEGYWEEYFSNSKLIFKGNYVNNKRDGYSIEYYNKIYHKFFYKNGYRYYKSRYVYYSDFHTF